MRAHLRLLAVIAAVALTAACGASFESGDPPASTPGIPSPTTPPPPPTVAPTPGPSDPAAPVPEGLREQPRVAAAIADTATREGVDPSQVVVAAWSPVTWNDGSLGCPQPGMSYTQATVDGELLILRVESGLFQYHARTGGPFTYCVDPTAGYAVG